MGGKVVAKKFPAGTEFLEAKGDGKAELAYHVGVPRGKITVSANYRDTRNPNVQ